MADQENSDWIVSELRRAAAGERAPARLREQIDAMSRRASRPSRPWGALGAAGRRRRWALVPVAGLVAAVILALIFILPGGAGGPTVAQAAAATTRAGQSSYPPIGRSESASPGSPESASYANFARVRLPSDLQGRGTWKYSGAAVDTLDGRRILELFYSHGTRVLVYAIAAKPLLRGQTSGFRSFTVDGHTVLSWQESGHSCLLTSATTSAATLRTLARS